MRVITFSKFFQKGHPRQGEPTYFVEKIINLVLDNSDEWYDIDLSKYPYNKEISDEKSHTIRAGNRWKVGDYFSPRIWSDKPYRSKQIQFAPPIEIKKIWDFEIDKNGVYKINGNPLIIGKLKTVAKNDGLDIDDFECWFPNKEFHGQILCWNENINY